MILKPIPCKNKKIINKLFIVFSNLIYLKLGLKIKNKLRKILLLVVFFTSLTYHSIQVFKHKCDKILMSCMVIDILVALTTFLIFFIKDFYLIKNNYFGVLLFLISLFCFSFNWITEKNYMVLHSLFHIFSGLSLYSIYRNL